MPIHPQIEAILAAAEPGQISDLEVADARSTHAAAAAARPPGPAMAVIEDTTMAGVGVRAFTPNHGTGATTIYFHGGGWVIGSVDTHDGVCRALADGSGATVVSVEYRLAPEHPFPAAYDDALAVVTEAQRRWGQTGLAVAGDSAGGNLAAGVAQAMRHRAGPSLRAQLLVYPALDAAMTAPSHRENRDGPFMTGADLGWFYRHYGDGAPSNDRRLSPIYEENLDGLPPALIITAEFDVLRDEGEAYAHALAGSGVEAVAVRYPGTTHGFFGWAHAVAPSAEAVAAAARWLRQHLA